MTYLGSQFQRLQSTWGWLCCFGACGGADHHGGRAQWNKAAHLTVAWKQEERGRSQALIAPSRPHTSDLTSFSRFLQLPGAPEFGIWGGETFKTQTVASGLNENQKRQRCCAAGFGFPYPLSYSAVE